jgi:hypothetical protein
MLVYAYENPEIPLFWNYFFYKFLPCRHVPKAKAKLPLNSCPETIYGLKYETTPHTTFLCLAISWSILGEKSKLIVFWKPENLPH